MDRVFERRDDPARGSLVLVMREQWWAQQLDGLEVMRAVVDVELQSQPAQVELFGVGSLLPGMPGWLTLSGEEQDRAQRFRLEDDRRRFWTGRALVAAGTRAVTGDTTGWRFLADPRVDGTSKPAWMRESDPAAGPRPRTTPEPRAMSESRAMPSVSISHAASVVVVALCMDAEVGVDVQDLAALAVMGEGSGDIAEVMFAEDERRAMTGIEEVAQGFTAKEAVLKAVGWGLAIDPRSLQLRDGRVAVFDAPQARPVGLKRLSLPEAWGDFAAHVAVSERSSRSPAAAKSRR